MAHSIVAIHVNTEEAMCSFSFSQQKDNSSRGEIQRVKDDSEGSL